MAKEGKKGGVVKFLVQHPSPSTPTSNADYSANAKFDVESMRRGHKPKQQLCSSARERKTASFDKHVAAEVGII